MPTIQCQHCQAQLDNFPKYCPECEQPIMGTTAVQFIGDGLTQFLEANTKKNPEAAKKKTSLYLKLCQSFLCDSELALLSVKMFNGAIDDNTSEAIEDVIGTHKQHTENLRNVLRIISQEPSLEPVATKANNIGKRLDTLMKAWLHSDFGGRSL